MPRCAPLLVLFFALSGCFDPDNEMLEVSSDSSPGECMPEGDRCSVNADCCEWDGSTRSGAGLCVNFGEFPECTAVCYDDRDCAMGCCAALEESNYGACGPCSADPYVPTNQTCLAGVAYFCDCGDALGVPCGDDRALFEESCASDGPTVEVFECFAENADQACADALEACPVEVLAGVTELR